MRLKSHFKVKDNTKDQKCIHGKSKHTCNNKNVSYLIKPEEHKSSEKVFCEFK